VWEVPNHATLAVAVTLRCYFTAANWLDDIIDREVKLTQIPSIVNGSTALLALGQAALFNLKNPLPVMKILNQTLLAAAAGEQLDLQAPALSFDNNGQRQTELEYLEQARLKTGMPLANTCIAIAEQAETSPLTEAERNGLYEFGVNFGIVCQIENDMDALSPNAQHKTDLVSLKTTLPLLFLRDKVPVSEYSELLAQVVNNEPESRKKLFTVLMESGAINYSQLVAQLYIQPALEALTSTERGENLGRLLGLVKYPPTSQAHTAS
jgi:geranylgeranyl pyrophosphate synthase